MSKHFLEYLNIYYFSVKSFYKQESCWLLCLCDWNYDSPRFFLITCVSLSCCASISERLPSNEPGYHASGDNAATTSRSGEKHLWFYICFYNPNNHQTQQDGRPVCTNFTWKLMVESLLLSYVTNSYGWQYNSVSPLTNKLGKTVDQHALALGNK